MMNKELYNVRKYKIIAQNKFLTRKILHDNLVLIIQFIDTNYGSSF